MEGKGLGMKHVCHILEKRSDEWQGQLLLSKLDSWRNEQSIPVKFSYFVSDYRSLPTSSDSLLKS